MQAQALARTLPADRQAEGRPALGLPTRRCGLGALLAATARRHPARPLLTDLGDKPGWCGRPAMGWSYGAAAEIVNRLARGIRAWRLPPGSRVGLWFPGGSEGLVAHLAVEAAGHVPCPMPAAWDEARLLAGIEAAGIRAVLTQGRLGARRPAEILCRVALGCFALRYLAAFGPDVPDGVINLDAMALERGAPDPAPEGGGGLVSFAGRDPLCPVLRPGDALLAAVAAHLVAARIGPAERLVTLLPPDDLRGLVTGLGAALVAGASLETMPVFDRTALARALAPEPAGRSPHLVAPAFLEGPLADFLPGHGRPASLTLVHRAPAKLTGRRLDLGARSGARIVDALVLGEAAVVSRARGADDIALALADPEAARFPAGLLELRRDAEGGLCLRGQAALPAAEGTREVGRAPQPEAELWRPAPYRIPLFAGTATAVLEA